MAKEDDKAPHRGSPTAAEIGSARVSETLRAAAVAGAGTASMTRAAQIAAALSSSFADTSNTAAMVRAAQGSQVLTRYFDDTSSSAAIRGIVDAAAISSSFRSTPAMAAMMRATEAAEALSKSFAESPAIAAMTHAMEAAESFAKSHAANPTMAAFMREMESASAFSESPGYASGIAEAMRLTQFDRGSSSRGADALRDILEGTRVHDGLSSLLGSNPALSDAMLGIERTQALSHSVTANAAVAEILRGIEHTDAFSKAFAASTAIERSLEALTEVGSYARALGRSSMVAGMLHDIASLEPFYDSMGAASAVAESVRAIADANSLLSQQAAMAYAAPPNSQIRALEAALLSCVAIAVPVGDSFREIEAEFAALAPEGGPPGKRGPSRAASKRLAELGARQQALARVLVAPNVGRQSHPRVTDGDLLAAAERLANEVLRRREGHSGPATSVTSWLDWLADWLEGLPRGQRLLITTILVPVLLNLTTPFLEGLAHHLLAQVSALNAILPHKGVRSPERSDTGIPPSIANPRACVLVLSPRRRRVRVGFLPANTPLRILRKQGKWLQVEFGGLGNVCVGWVRSKRVRR